jgi:hypothetical protein
MGWNAKVRCIDDKGKFHTKGKIYDVVNGKFEDDDGELCRNEYSNIDDLCDGFTSKFELVEEENKTCDNCVNKGSSACGNCLSGIGLIEPTYWGPLETADTSKIDENSVTKSILINKEYKSLIGQSKHSYWDNICKMQQRQTDKGIKHYGQVLEDNLKMDMKTRLEYLQEEMIDGLMYIEHIKALLGIKGAD